jgi:hypothetical protein
VAVQLVEIDGRHLQQEDAQAAVWFGQVSIAEHRGLAENDMLPWFTLEAT